MLNIWPKRLNCSFRIPVVVCRGGEDNMRIWKKTEAINDIIKLKKHEHAPN